VSDVPLNASSGSAAILDGAPLLRATGFSKTFGPIRVLQDVHLSMQSHEIRGLLGQNGSGKSTFIKILSGYHEPDPGAQLAVREADVPLPVRLGADSAHDIAFVHQDLGLERSLPIVDNFWISSGHVRAGRPIRWREQRARAAAALREFGLEVDVRKDLGLLSDSQRAVVAIARALEGLGTDRRGVLVLDEPTVLLEQETKNFLFEAIGRVRDRGCAVLFVSHNLDEVRELCSTVSVLRDGRLVADGQLSDMSERALIHAILGKDMDDLYPPPPDARTTPIVLSAKHLRAPGLADVTFDLHEGEILGLCGLAGMGQDLVPQVIYGVRPASDGELTVFGQPLGSNPRDALERGVVFLPLDRKRNGAHENSTLYENLTLPVIDRYFIGGRVRRSKELREVGAVLQEFSVRPGDPTRKFGELSGGNQQKALLAKWLRLVGTAKILLLQEPTQGVDVGARQEIFQFISEAAANGAATLYCSTEYEDLAHLCDRVLIMRHGRIVAQIGRAHLRAERLEALALATELEPAG
jgi:ribose transport system ATP-binding protein